MRYAAIGDGFPEGVGDEQPDGSLRGWPTWSPPGWPQRPGSPCSTRTSPSGAGCSRRSSPSRCPPCSPSTRSRPWSASTFGDAEIRRAVYWSPDRLHLGPAGHHRVAGLVLAALGHEGTKYVDWVRVDPVAAGAALGA